MKHNQTRSVALMVTAASTKLPNESGLLSLYQDSLSHGEVPYGMTDGEYVIAASLHPVTDAILVLPVAS